MDYFSLNSMASLDFGQVFIWALVAIDRSTSLSFSPPRLWLPASLYFLHPCSRPVEASVFLVNSNKKGTKALLLCILHP
jgi:hypothetical protein